MSHCKWKKVSEELPKYWEVFAFLVVAVYEGQAPVVLRACYQKGGWYGNNYEDNSFWKITGRVTHWRPLPDFPENCI